MKQKLFAGVDIGGTKTAVLLSAEPPHILKRIEFPTLPQNGPDPALNQIKLSLHSMLAELSPAGLSPVGIGVSCGSPLDAKRGIIQAPPNLPTWIDIPIVEFLEAEYGCPVFLENDANAGALADTGLKIVNDLRTLHGDASDDTPLTQEHLKALSDGIAQVHVAAGWTPAGVGTSEPSAANFASGGRDP